MEGRHSCALLALLLATLAGCDQKRLLPIWNRTPDPHASRKPADLPISDGKPKKLLPETLVAMGQFREEQGRDVDLTPQGREYYREQARTAYQRALTIDEKHLPAHLALARLYVGNGSSDRAMASYESALKLEPKNAALHYEIGMVLAQQKQWDRALEMLRKATELDSDNRVMARSYGLALARAGQVPESLTQLRKVLKEAEAHCMIARMMRHLKNDEACQHHLQTALRIDPNLGPAKELLAELQGRAPAEATATVGHSETQNEDAIQPSAEPAKFDPVDAVELETTSEDEE